MQAKNWIPKMAAGLSLALAATAPASAQSLSFSTTRLSPVNFSASTQRDTWHAVLLISAVVGIIGLIDGDSTLALLGGAGVLLALYESNGSAAFHFRKDPGLDLVHSGPLAFGVNPLGFAPQSLSFGSRGPSAYVQLRFKF